jgi:hypothetical protein
MGAPRIHKITISKAKAADLIRRCGSALGVARAIEALVVRLLTEFGIAVQPKEQE